MSKDNLTVFARIKGIGSASGLFLKGNLLYIISDNSAFLYQYNLSNKILDKFQILSIQHTPENIAKAVKPDFEVLCNYKQHLYILGSGSTSNRELMVEYHLETKVITHYSLAGLYARIKKKHAIDDDNLNIEGAVFTGKDWFLFNRGNGSANKNGIFKIYGKTLFNADKIEFTPLALLNTNNLVASFTDVVLHQSQLYFIAAAEDTKSTYEDGKILGSYIGSINVDTLNLNFTKKVADDKKLEGITFFAEKNKKMEFLVCEDKDSEVLETVIYKLTI